MTSRNWTYFRGLSILSASVLAGEFAIMLLFDKLNIPDTPLMGIADAGLLTLLVLPAFSLVLRQLHGRQRIAEEAIKKLGQSQHLLNRLLTTTSNGIIIVNDQGIIVTDNEAALRILSAAGERFTGRRATSVLPPGLIAEYESCRNQTAPSAPGVLFTGRLDVTRADGKELVLDVRIQTFRSMEREFVTYMLYDVTALCQSQNQIAQAVSERDNVFANLSAVCDNVDFGVLLVDSGDNVQLVNKAYCQLWKIEMPHERLPLMELFALSNGLKREAINSLEWKNFVCNVLEREECEKGEIIERPDGTALLYRYARLPNGYKLLTYLDTTDTANRQKLIEEARKAADAANRAKSDFLASMSHELRTPLNGIIGMASLLVETELSQDQKLYAETISRSGDTLLTLVNDILDLSKIESGKFEVDSAPFNLANVADDVMSIMVPRANENGIELVMRYSPTLQTEFLGDGGRVRQILSNLVGNAVKFTPDGHILLDIDGEKVGESVALIMRVQDTGIGIPADKLDKIFSKFEQVDAASNRKYSGTGLGLSITRQLVEIMGGSVTVESVHGNGSTFTVKLTLPLGIKKSELEIAESTIAKCRAFVVDDNPVNRLVLQERLESWKVEVIQASDASTALTLLEHEANAGRTFDIVLLDHQMPGMTGYALAQTLHKRDEWKHVPVIMLSSSPTGATVEELRAIGVVSSMTKPFRASALFDSIANAIYKKKQPDIAKSAQGGARGLSIPTFHGDLKLLVADDNKTNRLVLKSMLNLPRLNLQFAVDGQDAFEKFESFTPDIVLMDVSMPVTDGFQATSLIRKFEDDFGYSRTPIIALTANALRGDREACLNAGMDDYLTKPVNRTALLASLARWEKVTRETRLKASNNAETELSNPGTVQMPNSQLPLLDIERLETLANEIGTETMSEIISECVAECQAALALLQAQVAESDNPGIRETLHLIRGCASNVGVECLVAHSDRLRDTLIGNGSVREPDVRELSKQLASASRALDDWLEQRVA